MIMVDDHQSREWQEKAKIVRQLSNLIAEYEMRKSKLIKYVPTEKELREAMRLYRYTLELAEEGEPNAVKLLEIMNSVSKVPEEQIKFTGFMDEILKKYPAGEVPHDSLMDVAEKWGVLDYIVEDIVGILGIKFRKLK